MWRENVEFKERFFVEGDGVIASNFQHLYGNKTQYLKINHIDMEMIWSVNLCL